MVVEECAHAASRAQPVEPPSAGVSKVRKCGGIRVVVVAEIELRIVRTVRGGRQAPVHVQAPYLLVDVVKSKHTR